MSVGNKNLSCIYNMDKTLTENVIVVLYSSSL